MATKYFDQDELEDYAEEDDWYEEDYDEEEDEFDQYDDHPQKPQVKPPPVATKPPAKKPLPQAAAIKDKSFPLVPKGASSSSSSAPKAFGFDTPSPDDKVLNAQSKVPTASNTKPSAASAVTQKLSSMAVDATTTTTPTPTSAMSKKPLSQYKPDKDLEAACQAALKTEAAQGDKSRLHLVVLGHVDAGKSTLMGRFLYEVGLINEKTVHKTKRDAAAAGKASFAWAWMLDERPEERARGVTVDVAVTRFETAHRLVTLLDAPGHRDFVPNMITGAAQADAALIVVDGSPGGFEAGFETPAGGFSLTPSAVGGGQTREHAQLARSLGIEQAAIVVSKLDTCEYSQERFEYIKSQLEPFLTQQCGFKTEALQWLPAVGPLGLNLVKPPTEEPLLTAWWKEGRPTLSQAIDNFTPAHRLLERPLRIPILESGTKTGKGAITVSGKIEGGAIKVGGKVYVLPCKELATVKALEVDGKPATLAMAGMSVDVTLIGLEANSVSAGSVLCHPDFPAPLVSKIEAQIVLLELAGPMLKGQQVTIHAHAAQESGHVSALIALLDGKSAEVIKQKPRCLLKGQTASVEITPSRPLCVETYADYKALGRLALRDRGRTIAVGVVTAVEPA